MASRKRLTSCLNINFRAKPAVIRRIEHPVIPGVFLSGELYGYSSALAPLSPRRRLIAPSGQRRCLPSTRAARGPAPAHAAPSGPASSGWAAPRAPPARRGIRPAARQRGLRPASRREDSTPEARHPRKASAVSACGVRGPVVSAGSSCPRAGRLQERPALNWGVAPSPLRPAIRPRGGRRSRRGQRPRDGRRPRRGQRTRRMSA